MEKIIALLERARECEREIWVHLKHIERLHRIAARTKNNPYASPEYAAQICEKLALLEMELNAHIDQTANVKKEALVYISFLTGDENSVLHSYYMLGMDWASIADKLYMSLRRVYMLRKSGLRKIEKHFAGKTPEKEEEKWESEQG